MTDQESVKQIVEKYDTNLRKLTSNATAKVCLNSLQTNLIVNNVSW